MSCARAAMSHASRARPAGLDRAPGASCDDIDRALGAYREHQPSRVDGDAQEGHSRKVPFPQQQGTPYSDPVEAVPFPPLATGHGRLRLIANRSGMRSCHDWLLVAGRKSMRARRTPERTSGLSSLRHFPARTACLGCAPSSGGKRWRVHRGSLSRPDGSGTARRSAWRMRGPARIPGHSSVGLTRPMARRFSYKPVRHWAFRSCARASTWAPTSSAFSSEME